MEAGGIQGVRGFFLLRRRGGGSPGKVFFPFRVDKNKQIRYSRLEGGLLFLFGNPAVRGQQIDWQILKK